MLTEFLDHMVSGQDDDIIAAVDRAVKDGMDVINMSLGATLMIHSTLLLLL